MKKRKRTIALIVLCFILSFSIVSFADNGSTIVYITKTGSKYHTGSCSYLKKSKIEITLADAVARGYDPCSRCNPPRLDSASSHQAAPTSKANSVSNTAKPTKTSYSTSKPINTQSNNTNYGTLLIATSRPTSKLSTAIPVFTEKPANTEIVSGLHSDAARVNLPSNNSKNESSSSHFGIIAVGLIAFLIGRFVKRKRG